MTLYDDLGVAPDASQEAIKRAWRKGAKTHHPDAGGDAEKFGALVKAYEVLSDETARERYDRTGETEKPDDVEKRAREIVTGIFEAVLNSLDDGPVTVNLVGVIRDQLNDGMRTVRATRAKSKAKRERLRRLRERLSGPVLEAALDKRIRQLESAIERADAELAAGNRALELLERCRHTAEDDPEQFMLQGQEGWTVMRFGPGGNRFTGTGA